MNHRTIFLNLFILFLTTGLFAQDNNELFWKAAKSNDVKILQELLDQGIDVNTKNHYGLTALTFATDKGNLEAVNFLLENGADPNLKDSFYNETPLGWAIYKKNIPIITSMINHGGDVKNENIVMSAAWAGLTDIVRLMLDKGAPGAGNVLLAAIANNDSSMFDMAITYSLKNDSLLSQALVSATMQKNDRFIAGLQVAGAKLPPESPEQVPGKIDENLVGTYSTKEMTKVELVVTDGILTASFEGSPEYTLKYSNDSTFTFTDIPGLSVTVQRIAGMVTGITLIRPDRSTPFLKINEQSKKETGTINIQEDHTSVAKPENWPSFRGNQISGIADGQHPPVTWDAKSGSNLIWKRYIPGLAHASPVVWGNTIFLITAQSSDTNPEYRVGLFGDVEPANDTTSHIWKIYCIDKSSGKIKWEKKAYEGIPRVKRHVKGSQANATPATTGEYVVAVFGSEGMICYEATTGKIRFKETIKGGGAFSASPVAADGKIYFTSEEKGVFVLKAGDEFEVITSNPVGEICMATPAISDGLIFIRGQHHLFCFGVAK